MSPDYAWLMFLLGAAISAPVFLAIGFFAASDRKVTREAAPQYVSLPLKRSV